MLKPPDIRRDETGRAAARPQRVLAVASAGGHWVQLMRLRPAWDDCAVSYLTTNDGYRDMVMEDAAERGQARPRYFTVVAANRWRKLRLIRQCLEICAVVLRVRPNVVITTGAAPGYLAIRLGKLIGARTVWVDSIANAQEMSLSGQKAGRHSDMWLTQWDHLGGRDERRPAAPPIGGRSYDFLDRWKR